MLSEIQSLESVMETFYAALGLKQWEILEYRITTLYSYNVQLTSLFSSMYESLWLNKLSDILNHLDLLGNVYVATAKEI